MNLQNDQANQQGEELSAQVRTLEFEISKTLNRTEDLNRQLDQKQYEMKQKEQAVSECEREIQTLKS